MPQDVVPQAAPEKLSDFLERIADHDLHGTGSLMVHGTAVVWLPVSDVGRSLSFYRDTLSPKTASTRPSNSGDRHKSDPGSPLTGRPIPGFTIPR